MAAIGRKLWSVLTVRGPARGTKAEVIGRYSAAIAAGLIFWWVRRNS
jgi:hypothetical protein